MNTKTIGLLVGIILVGGAVAWLFFAGYLDFSGRTYYTPKNTSSSYTRKMNAKFVLEASYRRAFRLTPEDGSSIPFDLPEEVIDKTAAVLRKVRVMEKEWHYGYSSLEEYILAARLGLFTYTGATQKFDEKKICTLPVKDPETLLAIVDQFFAGLIHPDKRIEDIKIAVNKQLSYECGFLNLNPHENSLEAYLLAAHKFKKELDPKPLATFPIKNTATHYLIARGFALKGSLKDNLAIAQSYAKRKDKSIISYSYLLASQEASWQNNKATRLKVALNHILYSWNILDHVKEDIERNTNPAWIKIAQDVQKLFWTLLKFSDFNYKKALAESERIDSICSALSPNSIRSCVENKIVLAYLYLYESRFSQVEKMLLSAEYYPLAPYNEIETYRADVPDTTWKIFKATRLARAQAQLYIEQKNYTKTKESFLKDLSYHPFSRDVIELRITFDALNKKPVFMNLRISQ